MDKLPTFREARDKLFMDALTQADDHVVNASKLIEVDPSTLYKWKKSKRACKSEKGSA